MKKVADEPVLAFPDLQSLRVEPHHLFLLIYTRSLADCMARVLDTQDPQEIADELCALTLQQFGANTTVQSTAQSTVDKIVLKHHEVFETSAPPASSASETLRREDISLLVRNFHATLATRSKCHAFGLVKNILFYSFIKKNMSSLYCQKLPLL